MQRLFKRGIPRGLISLWSGSVASIPTGWHLCDGANGTPNLTGRFIVHADADVAGTYNPGDVGGDTSHNHAGVTGDPSTAGVDASGGPAATRHPHTHTIDSDDHLPPYYALAYIMKL